jgi:hypothetical protein
VCGLWLFALPANFVFFFGCVLVFFSVSRSEKPLVHYFFLGLAQRVAFRVLSLP